MAVFPGRQAAALLAKAARALRPGGRLVVELLNPERIDKKDSTWWFADDKGLWGERPFLHLGERRWEAAERASVERFTTLDLASGALSEIVLCDQSYEVAEMTALLRGAGLAAVGGCSAGGGVGLFCVSGGGGVGGVDLLVLLA